MAKMTVEEFATVAIQIGRLSRQICHAFEPCDMRMDAFLGFTHEERREIMRRYNQSLDEA